MRPRRKNLKKRANDGIVPSVGFSGAPNATDKELPRVSPDNIGVSGLLV